MWRNDTVSPLTNLLENESESTYMNNIMAVLGEVVDTIIEALQLLVGLPTQLHDERPLARLSDHIPQDQQQH